MPLTVQEFESLAEAVSSLPRVLQRAPSGEVKAVYVQMEHVLQIAKQLVEREPRPQIVIAS